MSDHLIWSPNLPPDFVNSTLGFATAFGEASFTRYLKYFGQVVVHCEPPFFSTVVASGEGGCGAGWGGGGANDVQAASNTTHHFKSKPSYAKLWALGVLASPSHVLCFWLEDVALFRSV